MSDSWSEEDQREYDEYYAAMREDIREQFRDEVYTLEAFPEKTNIVIKALVYNEEGNHRPQSRGAMTRGDIDRMLSSDIDLNKDQIKYRLERLNEEGLVDIEWKDHPEYRTPTAYYTLNDDGAFLYQTNVYVRNIIDDPDELEIADIHALVDEIRNTRSHVRDLEDRLEELEGEVRDDDASDSKDTSEDSSDDSTDSSDSLLFD